MPQRPEIRPTSSLSKAPLRPHRRSRVGEQPRLPLAKALSGIATIGNAVAANPRLGRVSMLRQVSRLGTAAACLTLIAQGALASAVRSATDQKRASVVKLENRPYSAGLLIARAVHAGLIR